MWGKNRQRPIIAATSVRAGGLRGRLLAYGTGISPMRGALGFPGRRNIARGNSPAVFRQDLLQYGQGAAFPARFFIF